MDDSFVHVKRKVIYDVVILLKKTYDILDDGHKFKFSLRIYFPDDKYKLNEKQIDKLQNELKKKIKSINEIKVKFENKFKQDLTFTCLFKSDNNQQIWAKFNESYIIKENLKEQLPLTVDSILFNLVGDKETVVEFMDEAGGDSKVDG